jgi:hypothetical protein
VELRSLNCGSPRKRFVEVEITLDYPNKHEIKRIFSHVAAPGGHRIVENQILTSLAPSAVGVILGVGARVSQRRYAKRAQCERCSHCASSAVADGSNPMKLPQPLRAFRHQIECNYTVTEFTANRCPASLGR